MKRLLALALLFLPAAAQEESAPPAPEPAPAPPSAPVHEVRLRSGSLLVGGVEPTEWKVKTAFGTLQVPVREIRRVRFGRRAQPERLAEVEKAIADLGSGNPDRRQYALASLKEAGSFACASLARAVKDDEDPEVRRMCQEVLDDLGLEPEEYLQDDDQVETAKFDLRGTVELSSFRVNVAELGPMSVRRGDVVQVRIHEEDHSRKFTVTGANMWPNGWLDTKVQVKKGDVIVVSAKGSIHFPNWGGQVFNPDGSPHMGNINGLALGALGGRIGDAGPLFLVGSSYRGRATAAGTLQLILVMNAQGQPHSGEYTVTVTRGDDE